MSGTLNWTSLREFYSVTFLQSGFELKNTIGWNATLWLSKTDDIKHRNQSETPYEADIKDTTVKKETTCDWFVTSGLETDEAALHEKPDVGSLGPSNNVDSDLGILNNSHT